MKLTKADTARHLNISRQTLYEWIKQGRISVDQDGNIDSAEVVRLSGSVHKPDTKTGRPGGQRVTPAKSDIAVDVYRQMVDMLTKELEEARQREEFYRSQVNRLTDILDRRLLEAPRSAGQHEVRPRLQARLWSFVQAYLPKKVRPQEPASAVDHESMD